jgi:OFA family oxalate/formate antiporter-like MFS transporter
MSDTAVGAPPSELNEVRENRWLIASMGTVLQTCLGGVYAWSFFQKPIMAAYSWNNTQVAWIFSIAICFLGLAAAWGGINLQKYSPRKLAISGGILFAVGYILSAVAMWFHSLPLFYLSYGVIGGCGLGLGYVTPVATCAKWFPDKKGFITGMVVMGFGLGALVMSKLFAPILMSLAHGDLPIVFLSIGVIMAVVAPSAGWFLKNPPQGYVPAGWNPPQTTASAQALSDTVTVRDCLSSKQFIIIWLFFFANIAAGMMFIGFQSPMLQDLLRATEPYLSLSPEASTASLAAAGATLIGISSLFNGLGRFFWGGLSDRIGRIVTFRLILSTQILVFLVLPYVQNPIAFSVLVCYVLLCYGGGFGTAPSTVLTVFGSRLMPVVYGTLLTAWSAGGIVGPQVVAFLKDTYGAAATNTIFGAGAATLAFGFVLALLINDQPLSKKA